MAKKPWSIRNADKRGGSKQSSVLDLPHVSIEEERRARGVRGPLNTHT